MYRGEGDCIWLQAAVESIVEGLFSVLVTMGVVPIIRCPKVCMKISLQEGAFCYVLCAAGILAFLMPVLVIVRWCSILFSLGIQ